MLLHPGSLPGAAEHGALGQTAAQFLDFLHAAGMALWQMLPVNPAGPEGSPYAACSSRAGEAGFIARDPASLGFDPRGATGGAGLLAAFEAGAGEARRRAFAAFTATEAGWLQDYALFQVIRARHAGAPWWEWPASLRHREPGALAAVARDDDRALRAVGLEQFLFFEQWRVLRARARERGVMLLGDLPMYVAADSCDVWCAPGLFALAADGRPAVVAGVPPDYFSATGQRWGNPVFCWQAHAAEGFAWWTGRIAHQLRWFDGLRLDHFRGLSAAWSIPAESPTAQDGRWVDVPGRALLQRLRAVLGRLPFVAEDLGTITPEVTALRDAFALPGMAVLQFAFDSDERNPYLPHNHRRRSLVCTGTHDNDTTLGWFTSLDTDARARVLDYLGQPREPMPWPLVRAALASVADTCVLPMQDLLALGSDARLNTPGTLEGNWRWAFDWAQVPGALAPHLAALARRFGRAA